MDRLNRCRYQNSKEPNSLRVQNVNDCPSVTTAAANSPFLFSVESRKAACVNLVRFTSHARATLIQSELETISTECGAVVPV